MLRKRIKSFSTFASVVYKMFYYQRRTNLVTLSRRALNDWSNLLINKYSKAWFLFTVEFQELLEIFWETYRLNSREFLTFLLFAYKNVAFYTKQEFSQVLNFSRNTLVVAWMFFCFLSESIDCERKSLDFEGHTWNRGKCGDIHTYKGGEFHISHDASLHTILSSFRTHVILSVQQDATVEQWWSDLFRRWNLLYLWCVDIFTILALPFQIHLLLSQRECFGRRYLLTCRPIARQSARKIFASVRLVLTCLDKAPHSQAISTCLSLNKYLFVCVRFLFVACLWSRCSLSGQ